MRNLLKNTLIIIFLLSAVISLSACETRDVSQANPNDEALGLYNSTDVSNAVTSRFSADKSDDSQPTAAIASNNDLTPQNTKTDEGEHVVNVPPTSNSVSDDISDTNSTNNTGTHSESDMSQEDSSTLSSTCKFIINCETAIMSDKLSDSMRNILPQNGIIFNSEALEFNDGETVFDILARITRENNIPIEFTFTPGFGSKYIEGINSLREMDCGKDSGWLYKVNDVFPNYGCDKYTIHTGDSIGFYYTLNRGDDLK